MIVLSSCHPRWLVNSYLVADEPGGSAILIDGGAPMEPILEGVERHSLRPTELLVTHRHPDHIEHLGAYRERLGLVVCGHGLEAESCGGFDRLLDDREVLRTGDLEVEVLHVPGHTAGHLAYLVNGQVLFSGDTLFRGSVGGTRGSGHTCFEDLRHSVVEVLLGLPPETVIFPGHCDSTTVERERFENPFVRAWRTGRGGAGVPCQAHGEAASLLLRAPDYDGGTKCWVRFETSGSLDIVAGSRVEVAGEEPS